jgi:SAM-dependent methyltransferase
VKNINSRAYWEKVYSEEINNGQWRRYPVGFNKIKTYLGLKSQAHETILDVGCGYGVLADHLKSLNCPITGWDLSEVALKVLDRKGFNTRLVDFVKYEPTPEENFDHVIATEFLEHVENPVAELAKLYHMAQKNVILTVPNNESTHNMSSEHLHSFDPDKIKHLTNGLEIERLYIEEYLEEFFYLNKDGNFKIIRTPNLLVILEKGDQSPLPAVSIKKRADFKKMPVDICVCTFSSDHTESNDHFDLITRCLLSVINNTDPSLYTFHIGCNNLSLRAMAFVDWLVSCYGARKYIGSPIKDANGSTIYPKYPLMAEMYDASNGEWVVWFDDDSHVTASDWLEKLENKINRTPLADQFGDESIIVLSLAHQQQWIEPALWYTPGKIEYQNFPEGLRIVSPFICGGFYAISRNAIQSCHIPDPRVVHNDGDWTTGMALHHKGFKITNHIYGVKINDEPRRGIHADKRCLADEAEHQRVQAEKIAINTLVDGNSKIQTV